MTSRGRYQTGSGRLNKGRTSQMCTTKAHLCTFFILLIMFFAASAQTAMAAETKTKLSPIIKFGGESNHSVDATVGTVKFERPTLSITDSEGKSISRYFSLSWSFKGGTDSTDTSGREYSVDKTTGSVISKLYDGVTIGRKTGTATVVLTLSIAPRYKDTYEFAEGAQKSASYTINVKSPTVTAEYYNSSTKLTKESTLQIYKYGQGGQYTSVPVPTTKLYYSLDNSNNDVTSYYDYKYAVTDGFTVSNNTITAAKVGDGTLTITATPKDEYKSMLGSDAITTTVKLNCSEHDGKIKTYISFASHELDTYKYRNNQDKDRINSPYVIVKDEFGNDITSLVITWDVKWQMDPQNVFQKFSKDPHDSINEIKVWYGALTSDNRTTYSIGNAQDDSKKLHASIQFGRPDDYIITVNVNLNNTDLYEKPVADPNFSETVTGQFYNANGDAPYSKDNTYAVASNQLLLRVHKRVPTIKLSPDPSTVQLAEGYTMTAFNRFNIIGEIKDPYTSDPTETKTFKNNDFSYKFFLPDNMNYGSDAAKKESNNVTLQVTTIAPSTSCYEWVPAYHNGEIQKNADGTTKMELMHGTYYESWNGYNNENFSMVFHLPEGKESADNVPIIYTIMPWNPIVMDVGISGYYNFKVVKKEPTHFVIEPKKQVNSVGQTIPCPSIKVADQFGVDVTDQFDLTRSQSTTSSEWTLNGDGSVTSANPGTYTVDVNGTLKKTSTKPFENPSQDTYEMIFQQGSTGSTGAYEVIYDKDHNEKMGKLHFIKAGDFFPGTTAYHEVPGINITFGSADDTENDKVNVWSLAPSPITDPSYFSNDKLQGADNDKDWADKTNKTLQKMSITANATTFGNDNLPMGGGFLKIEAVTNGWLYIDGNFQYDTDKKTGRHYIIVDASSKEQQTIGYIKDKDHPAADNVAEVKFPKPLLAGHTYYIYTDDGGMRIHGLRFEPGFIDPVTDALPWAHPGAVDTEPVAASTAFLNGYTGNLPTLAFHQPDPTVRWYCDDVKEGNTSNTIKDIVQCKDKEGKHVNISNTNGIVLGKAMTNEAPLNDKSRTGYANGRVRVYGEVKGIDYGEGKQVMKTPEYYLFVGDMPTYIVQEGEKHDQDERVSTTNIPTRIWMTFGGWHWTSNNDYPYYKDNDSTGTWLDDEWKTAKMDSVGHNEQTVDGFNFITWGAQNPSDELVRGWDKGNRNTFNLPVRGTYLKFEPEESGRLLLYVCMNGMTDIANGDTDAKKNKNGRWLRRRALYIVDETGKPVAIDDNSGWESKYTWGNYVNSGKTNSDRFNGYTNYYQNYYCDGVTRAAWEYTVDGKSTHLDIWDKTDKADSEAKKYSWMNAYDRNHDGTLDKAEQDNLDADYNKIHDWWNATTYTYKKTSDGNEINMNYAHSKLGGPLELIQLSDSSYVLPTKGYVRFTFQVYAGKVYYVFMTGSKLGFCGFGFIPSSYRANMNRWTDHSSDAKNADGTAFTDETYAKLPQPNDDKDNNLYLGGKSGNARLMGGAKTLDVALTAEKDGSYAKWKDNGFLFSGETDTSSGISTTTKNTARDFVNVTLKRTFLNQRWAGICLPFTVSETQMKKIFGENMQLVTVDSVMASEGHDRTLHLTQHANQLLEAGRPYLIYPNVSGTTEGDPIGESTNADGKTTYSVTFKGVTVESVKPMTVIMKNEEVVKHNKAVDKQPETGQKVEIFTYQISGQYDKGIIPWYSYYMKNSANANENKFYRIIKPSGSTAKGRNLPGCNIWLYPYSSDAEGTNKLTKDDGSTTTPAKLADFWITGAEVAGNTATGIDEIVDDLNAATTTAFPGVYDLQGRQVRSTNNLQGLTPGIYLMGGRKYVVR